jgi:hypothetical protein
METQKSLLRLIYNSINSIVYQYIACSVPRQISRRAWRASSTTYQVRVEAAMRFSSSLMERDFASLFGRSKRALRQMEDVLSIN